MTYHGFVRVATAVPNVRVGDCSYNADRVLDLMARAERESVSVLVFPELVLTGYTCGDLFHQVALQRGAARALDRVVQASSYVFSGLVFLGLPVVSDGALFNCAAVVQKGRLLALVPKSFLPNYREFHEARWFTPGAGVLTRKVTIGDHTAPFGTDILIHVSDVEGLTVGVELCEDLWVPIPPSSLAALAGATVVVNLSASNEFIGKAAYRRQLVVGQSGRLIAAYVYSSSGPSESTTDLVFGGHCLVAENGVLLAESSRLGTDETLLVTDVDLDRLCLDRMRMNTFHDVARTFLERREFSRIELSLARPVDPPRLKRGVEAHPFVPKVEEELGWRCREIFQMQVAGLARRLAHIGCPPVTLGVSGGLDSTLALLVAVKTFDRCGWPCDRINAFTLPGFGTSNRTLSNARALMSHLGVKAVEIDIRALCLAEMAAMGHQPFGIDLTGLSVEDFAERVLSIPGERLRDLVFENVQARMRTSLLMNRGFVIGTGDISELSLGWCTFNGDHMSMYNPNASVPKTLVRFLVQWAARNEFDGEARRILLDVTETEISPELLPVGRDGRSNQATESAIGPYELHDFFLFHVVRHGATPEKVLYLARYARFSREYPADELRRWLAVFIERFFASQYKRSCMPDGPKVGSVSLSPRGDWRMPSDAVASLWLEWLSKSA